MITHNGKQVSIAMRNRKAINLIARNGKAIWDWYVDVLGIDAAAKAVILAEYGKQVWSDVRDYAKAHPAIVPFINQDPHLACSLSQNSNKERWLVFDGSTYIDTGIAGNAITNLSMRMYWESDESGYHINGSADNMQIGANANKWHNYKTATATFVAKQGYNIRAEVADGKWNTYVDEQQILSFATPSKGTTYTHTIGCWNGSQGKLYWCKQGVAEEVVNDLHLIPHQRPDGQCGMLDLVTYTFHPNANTQGQFTIAITDKE